MGTFVALEAAAQRPEVARSLVLLGTAGAMPVHPALQSAADADDPVAGRLITSWGIGSRAHTGGTRLTGHVAHRGQHLPAGPGAARSAGQ